MAMNSAFFVGIIYIIIQMKMGTPSSLTSFKEIYLWLFVNVMYWSDWAIQSICFKEINLVDYVINIDKYFYIVSYPENENPNALIIILLYVMTYYTKIQI